MPTVDPAIARALAEARAQAISEEHLNNVMGAQEWYLPADHPAMQLANRVAQVAPPAGGYVAAPVPGMVATQASGAHYSAPGARAGYEAAGMPPVMQQSNPYATAAFRTTMDPYGNVGVQPLVGFPSQYPHVVNGAVIDPMMREMPGLMPFMQVPAGPALQQATTPVRRAAAPAAHLFRVAASNSPGKVPSRSKKKCVLRLRHLPSLRLSIRWCILTVLLTCPMMKMKSCRRLWPLPETRARRRFLAACLRPGSLVSGWGPPMTPIPLLPPGVV